MKCHYITDKKTNQRVLIPGCMGMAVYNDRSYRVLIPGCMGMAVYNDRSYCTCRTSHPTTEERLSWLEEKVKELIKTNSDE
jgi:hypothetical protein